MKHKRFDDIACPIARSLDRVGRNWGMLVIREAFYGATKFDEFLHGVSGITPSTLTSRLNELTAAGMLERRLYNERPTRYEYVLTPLGRDFRPVLWAMMDWGSRHFCPEGALVQLQHRQTGLTAIPYLADRATGRELVPSEYRVVAGPAATAEVRARVARRLLGGVAP